MGRGYTKATTEWGGIGWGEIGWGGVGWDWGGGGGNVGGGGILILFSHWQYFA